MSAVIVNPGYSPQASLRTPEADAGSPVRAVRLRLTRRGRVVFTTLAAIPLAVWVLVAVLSAGGAAADAEGAAVGAGLAYVTVDAGASLWEIATAVDPSADPRVVIDEIVRLNGLDDAVIEPGQRLAVPNAG
ncbi:LysM peptidoglycan-binding domain-containing protein [Agromyces humatus]|uniref:LysM domain-containing protein n=1 Tax=Agromyces humatus TaxID=279573 RepID=A0ABN2K3G0_9MICO|nr:LysM peptidoglycan-binding domain-containing protein [Agromyces humatus]